MILTLNCGSSSLKYALYDEKCTLMLKGYKENITSHELALEEVIAELSPEQKKSIKKI
jgi:acetate kinase